MNPLESRTINMVISHWHPRFKIEPVAFQIIFAFGVRAVGCSDVAGEWLDKFRDSSWVCAEGGF